MQMFAKIRLGIELVDVDYSKNLDKTPLERVCTLYIHLSSILWLTVLLHVQH